MLIRGPTDLRPFKPVKDDEILSTIRGLAHRIALPIGLLLEGPMLRSQFLCMIRDRVEIQCRAVSGVIAGIRRGMRSFAAQQGHRSEKCVQRIGRVHVQVAKQNLLAVRNRVRIHACCRSRLQRDRAYRLVFSRRKQDEGSSSDQQQKYSPNDTENTTSNRRSTHDSFFLTPWSIAPNIAKRCQKG